MSTLPQSEDVDNTARPWLAAYAPGVPADIPPVTETLVDMLDASVAKFRRGVALEFFGVQTTYAQLGEQVARAAEGLRELGVKAGDRVALILPNCPQHVVAFYAALRLGAIVVEHNPLYTARELRHQFEVHEAVVAIVWDKVADTIAEFPSDIAPRKIVTVRMTDELSFGMRLALRLPVPKARESRNAMTRQAQAKGLVPWAKVVQARPSRNLRHVRRWTTSRLLQLTSGTTGRPKAAILTHRNLRSNAAQSIAWVPELTPGARSSTRCCRSSTPTG